ncbi:Hint domain-containing protein [Roseovarius sp.]|uniref:Hint domain-containing protein n=1 Tax=Roseovarius sp. TaxID=1486281 RepID=UPI000C4C7783|nr:Hint domain-containing protein [Roseovarius sp.]MAZ22513.1 type I secretion protein [Roseovarius sp.]
MPYLYIYSPSDFVQAPPIEQNGAAAGDVPFTLTLKEGATPTLVLVNDDDAVFDEVDGSQTLANALNLDGTNYAAGTSINSAYDLINSTTGHKVTTLHFGTDGNPQGAVHGLISTVAMTPGSSYTFNQERTSHQQANQYSQYTACFTPGTLIETAEGPRAIETLRPGDLIETRDHGLQPLRLLPSRHIDAEELQQRPNLRPVRLRADSIAPGVPSRDTLVSPQHRILSQSLIARRLFGKDEVLVAAVALTKLPGIEQAEDLDEITYIHLVLDEHQVVTGDGLASESFYCGPNAMQALSPEALAELQAVFPDMKDWAPGHMPPRARPFALGAGRRELVRRHARQDRSLLEAR